VAEELTRCFPCAYPGKYNVASIRWMKSEGKLCDDHKKKAEDLLANPPTEGPRRLVIKPVRRDLE